MDRRLHIALLDVFRACGPGSFVGAGEYITAITILLQDLLAVLIPGKNRSRTS
jgi:hypothetical protein